ncbi:MAG: DUF4129 domain-containing protein [Bacillaceae bacterium]|nr:DUF4129 domain-containing protein [Bacillaceae bacterium]
MKKTNEGQVRNELEKILNEPEYQAYYNQTFLEKMWARIQEWINDILASVFGNMGATGLSSTLFIYFIIIILIIVAIIVLVYMNPSFSRRRKIGNNAPIYSSHELEWTSEMHFAEAKRQEENMDYTKATRHSFLAILLFFHEQEWLKAKIWKTNWEYYEELIKVNRDTATFFKEIVLLFDEATYGEREINQEEYEPFAKEVASWLEKYNKSNEERKES